MLAASQWWTWPWSEPEAESTTAQELNDQLLYTTYAVFKAVTPLPEERGAIAEEAQGLLDELLQKDVYTRGTYDVSGLQGRRRPARLVDLPRPRRAAGRLQPLPADLARPAPRAGLVERRPAPAGGVQPQPHPGLRPPRGAEEVRLRLPLQPLARLVPAAGLRAPRHARRARHHGPGVRGRPRQHGRGVRASATTSGCWPSRPTSCTASSTVMRHLRAARARLHTKLETPFFTGAMKTPAEIVASLSAGVQHQVRNESALREHVGHAVAFPRLRPNRCFLRAVAALSHADSLRRRRPRLRGRAAAIHYPLRPISTLRTCPRRTASACTFSRRRLCRNEETTRRDRGVASAASRCRKSFP